MNTLWLKIILIICIVIICFIIMCNEKERTKGDVIIKSQLLKMPESLLSVVNYWYGGNSITQPEPYLDIGVYFPRHTILKNNWETIRNEALKVYTEGKTIDWVNFNRKDVLSNGWKAFYMKFYGEINEDAKIQCPNTCRLIQLLPEVKLAMFSIVKPYSRIKAHTGPFKGGIRYHLGLDCPKSDINKSCYLTVDGKKKIWKDGEDFLFDDTYLHEVVNNTDTARVILFCDVERTMSSSFAQGISNLIINKVGPYLSRTNDKVETQVKHS